MQRKAMTARLELWRHLVDRLSIEATRRGGRAEEDLDIVVMYPPQDSGEVVRVLRYIDETGLDQTIMIECGFAFRVAESLNEDEHIDYVMTTVTAVLDGNAAEIAEVAADGTWLHHASAITTPTGGGMTRIAPAWHLKEVPVDHEHRRPIDPWPRPAGAETFPPA
jgi:hypothetical protein